MGGFIQETLDQSSVDHKKSDIDWPVPSLIQRWMKTRGFMSFEEFDQFISFRLKDIKNPMCLKDMDLAVDRLIDAFNQQQKICIYADYDMDGTPGLALVQTGLEALGFNNCIGFQPDRFKDGYGVHSEIVKNFILDQGVELFLTVDVGITDVKAVDEAYLLGVDFIITDHHQPKDQLPKAVAIVNPNQKDCSSGLTYLCGTGVGFYLILALRKKMTELNLLKKDFDPKILLDCFAIATLTDMVPLVNENRTLVQHGLLQLAKTQRVGLQLLMEKLNLRGKRLSSSDVAIQLAPKLNALGRMNSSVKALDLFLERDLNQAVQKVEQTLLAQKQRGDIQKEGDFALDQYLETIKPKGFIFHWSESYYKGVLGLLATRVTKLHNVPSFIGSVMGDKIVGSARAPEGFSLLAAFESAKDCLTHFGGHHQAAGFELPLNNAPLLAQSLDDFFKTYTRTEPVPSYDLVAGLEELNSEFKSWFIKLEPYGVGFALPILRLDHLFVSSLRVLKEKHLKLVLKDIHGHKIDALWFFVDEIDEKKQLNSKRVSIVAEPSLNFYMGQETLQLLIKDLKPEY